MRRLSLMVLAVAALGLGASPRAEAEAKKAPKGPRISVEPDSFDFGRALQNKTLEKEFSLRNFGDQDLVIENVSTSCGCTVAKGYDKLVKPGASTALRVSLETRTSAGRVERRVAIRSNDTHSGLVEIKLQATVVPERAEK